MHPTQATTPCYEQSFEFQGLGSRNVVTDSSGGHLSSDGGCLLLREVDRLSGLCGKLAACFTDRRTPKFACGSFSSATTAIDCARHPTKEPTPERGTC